MKLNHNKPYGCDGNFIASRNLYRFIDEFRTGSSAPIRILGYNIVGLRVETQGLGRPIRLDVCGAV